MKIATWNVNSIKARLEPALAWLKQAKPDVVALAGNQMPGREFSRASRSRRWAIIAPYTDRRAYNGVAILSKRPLEDVTPRLPGGDGDDHARYLEAVVAGDKGAVRVASIYAPNGNPIGTGQIRLTSWPGWSGCNAHAKDLLAQGRAGGADGRLQHHSRRQGLLRSQGVGERRAVPARIPGGAAADRKSGLYRRLPRPASPKPANTHSGIIRPAPGARTTASASTISCCRRRRRTG